MSETKTSSKLSLNLDAISKQSCLVDGKTVTLVELSEKYGVSVGTVSNWTRGSLPEMFNIIIQIMKDYNLTFEELVIEYQPKKRPMKKKLKNE